MEISSWSKPEMWWKIRLVVLLQTGWIFIQFFSPLFEQLGEKRSRMQTFRVAPEQAVACGGIDLEARGA